MAGVLQSCVMYGSRSVMYLLMLFPYVNKFVEFFTSI